MSSANIIANLTEDLLTLAKIKNNVFEVNYEQNVNLLNIINDAYQVLSFNANLKNISLQIQFDIKKQYILQNVTTDKRRILQILLNFLSNSIKFTNDGGFIQINLIILNQKTIQNQDNNQLFFQKVKNLVQIQNQQVEKQIELQIGIQDNGAGISQENIGKLFTDFAKLNEHKQMNLKGTGLGLSICKQIIEQMGGQVSVQSKVGFGTQFKITLSLKALDNETQLNNSIDQNYLYENNLPEFFENNFKQLEQDDEIENEMKSLKSFNPIQEENQLEEQIKIFKFQQQNSNQISTNEDENQKSVRKIIQDIKNQIKKDKKEAQKNQNSSFSNSLTPSNQSDNISKYDLLNDQQNNQKIQKSQNQILESLDENYLDESQSNVVFLQKQNQAQENSNQQNMQELFDMWNSKQSGVESQNNFNFNMQQYQQQEEQKICENYQYQDNQNEDIDLLIIQMNQQCKQIYFNEINFLDNDSKELIIQLMSNEDQLLIDESKNKQLIQIEEIKESSSLHMSSSQDQSLIKQSESIRQQISSNINKLSNQIHGNYKLIQNEDFQNYLQKNSYLKQAIDISLQYKKKKLQFLVANDDQYSLFFIQTTIEQMKDVQHLDSVENGKIALDFVQKNAPLKLNEDGILENFYDAIFLDLHMPIMGGNEACKQIQNYYYQRQKDSVELQLFNQTQLDFFIQMNKINEDQFDVDLNFLKQKRIIPNWIVDLKKVYDIYQEISQQIEQLKQEINMNENEKKVLLSELLETKDQIRQVFNILYSNQRYNSLQILKRPFIFAYSAFINGQVIDETKKSGFEVCLNAPLNKLNIQKVIEDYITVYSFHLTRILLENIGAVPDFKQMIDDEKVMQVSKISSDKLYMSLINAFQVKHGLKQDHSSLDSSSMRGKPINDLISSESESFQDNKKRSDCFKIAGLSLIKEYDESKYDLGNNSSQQSRQEDIQQIYFENPSADIKKQILNK